MSLELLYRLGIRLGPGRVLGIYGPSMVGKSVLAAMLCRDYVGDGGTAVVYGIEEHYADDEYRSLIARHLPKQHYINYCPTNEELFRWFSVARRKEFGGRLCLVLDSLSYIAIREQNELLAKGYREPRVIAARVIPQLYTVAGMFKRIAVEKSALGIIVLHAGSTAGSAPYRGLTNLRPSMAMRVAHSLDYLLLLESSGPGLESRRRLTVVANRLNPLSEGLSIEFRFRNGRIEIIETEGKEAEKT